MGKGWTSDLRDGIPPSAVEKVGTARSSPGRSGAGFLIRNVVIFMTGTSSSKLMEHNSNAVSCFVVAMIGATYLLSGYRMVRFTSKVGAAMLAVFLALLGAQYL